MGNKQVAKVAEVPPVQPTTQPTKEEETKAKEPVEEVKLFCVYCGVRISVPILDSPQCPLCYFTISEIGRSKYCRICDDTMTDRLELREHLKSSKHYNLGTLMYPAYKF